MTIAAKIADFTLKTSYDTVPYNVKELAKKALIDYIAVTNIGSKEKSAEIMKRYVFGKPQNDECKAIGTDGYYNMEDAALMNGYFAHLLDYDDVGLAGHPSAVLLSTCFAMGETMEINGKKLMAAYIIGYEVSLKLAEALMPELTEKGWHGTPIFGTIGAAVCAGKIMKLSKENLIDAIGIAASMASGIMENFGTHTKPFHVGMAASNGIKAVKLAKEGLKASPIAIEGECGYARLFAHKKIKKNDVRIGECWELFLQDLMLKKYPCCSAAHTAINGIEELIEDNNIDYKNIKKIVVSVPKFTLLNLIYEAPKTPEQARFSMQYALACVLVTNKFDINSFSVHTLNDKEIKNVMKKIIMKEGECFIETPYIDNEPAVIDLYTLDGRYYNKRIDFAKGNIKNPFTEEELEEKFFLCLGKRTLKNEKFLEDLKAIEKIPDVKFFLGMNM